MLADYLELPGKDKAKELLENAKLFHKFNQHKRALQILDRAMEAEPELAEIYELQSDILNELDRLGEATQAHTKMMRQKNKELILKGRSFQTKNGEHSADKPSPLARTPWISILFRPRATMRWIVDTDPTRHFFLIGALIGIGTTFNIWMRQLAELELHLAIIIILTLVLGPIIGILGLLLSAKLYQWVGNSLGGRASFEQVKAAAAWSSLPTVINNLLFLPTITFSSQYLVNTVGIEKMNSGASLPAEALAIGGLLCGLLIPTLAMVVWGWVLTVVCTAEVHDFSIWRAIPTVVLPSLIMGVGISCCLSSVP